MCKPAFATPDQALDVARQAHSICSRLIEAHRDGQPWLEAERFRFRFHQARYDDAYAAYDRMMQRTS